MKNKYIRNVLGQSKNLSPVQLIVNGNAVSSPRPMANTFNDVFIKKHRDLKKSITCQIVENPLERLKYRLILRSSKIPILTLQPITTLKLRKNLGKLKGMKS